MSHRTDIPVFPILNYIILDKHFVRKFRHSHDFMKNICIPKYCLLVSFDVPSVSTNFSADIALETIKKVVQNVGF